MAAVDFATSAGRESLARRLGAIATLSPGVQSDRVRSRLTRRMALRPLNKRETAA